MARRKSEPEPNADVLVLAVAGFKHRGVFIRTGERCWMPPDEAADMRALNMVRVMPAEAVDG